MANVKRANPYFLRGDTLRARNSAHLGETSKETRADNAHADLKN